MKIEQLRRLADREEVDYQFLMSALNNYSRPREKISEWLKRGELIRVKKGIYVFGKDLAQSPYSLEVLANLLYGPSAISLTYALAFYGLIPERVLTITSITNKRHKEFVTAVGHFSYYYLHSKKYSIGIEIKAASANRQIFIASPEKAFCDYVYLLDKHLQLNNLNEVEAYLFLDLRLDQEELKKFNLDLLSDIIKIYNQKNLIQIEYFLRKWI